MTRKLTDLMANPEILKHIIASKPTKAPVIISPDNRIIDGHARYLAYKAMGAEECPVMVVDTPEHDERILSMSDNCERCPRDRYRSPGI